MIVSSIFSSRKFLSPLMYAIGLILVSSTLLQPAFACLNCHSDVDKSLSTHQPVQQGCGICHEGIVLSGDRHKNTKKTKFGLSMPIPGLCYECHDMNLFKDDKAHSGLPESCTACHNPHASNVPNLLVAAVPGLCIRCHGKKPFEGKIVHKPVSEGRCLLCHKLHSRGNKLLTPKEPDQCLTCHNRNTLQNSRHAPIVDERCSFCHSSHSSDKPSRLAIGLTHTCPKCHNALGTLGQQHDGIGFSINNLPCLGCHNPHNQQWSLVMKLENKKMIANRKGHSCNFCKLH